MPGILILDELQSATEGGGIKLKDPLQTQDGTPLLSPSGEVSINFDNLANNTIHMNKLNIPDDAMSGDKIHGGTISGFQSTGITDNASNTALTIIANGNVGIGTDTPAYALNIKSNSFSGSSILLERTDSGQHNDPAIIFSSAHGANDNHAMGGIWWKNNVNNNYNAMIRVKTADVTGTTGKLEFFVGSGVSNASTPSMTLESNQELTVASSYIRHYDYSLGKVGSDFAFHRYAQYYNNVNAGWYTVAVNPGNRAGGLFEVYDAKSSHHSHRCFYAGHMYGNMSVIYCYGTVKYSNEAVRQARIKESGTYDGAMLQIEVVPDATEVGIRLYDHMAASGWYLVNWVPDGTDPGGLGNFTNVNANGGVAWINFTVNGFSYSTG